MAVNQPSRQDLDRMLSEAPIAIRTALENASELKAYLDQANDAYLTGADNGFVYTVAEVAAIRAMLTALDKLHAVAKGQATQAAASDFFFDAKKLWGFRPVRR